MQLYELTYLNRLVNFVVARMHWIYMYRPFCQSPQGIPEGFGINCFDGFSVQTDIMDLLGSDLPVESDEGIQFAWSDGILLQVGNFTCILLLIPSGNKCGLL